MWAFGVGGVAAMVYLRGSSEMKMAGSHGTGIGSRGDILNEAWASVGELAAGKRCKSQGQCLYPSKDNV